MIRFYQTEWQNIKFDEITAVSLKNLPDARFYNLFYEQLFSRYESYEDLDVDWRKTKNEVAEWIFGQCETDKLKVLSVGCGIGYIEYRLILKYPQLQIHISDFASKALKWIKRKIPEDRVHLADNPLDGSFIGTFDIIYFSAVDYAMLNSEMIELLKTYKPFLKPSGKCILISASFLDNKKGLSLIRKIRGLLNSTRKWIVPQKGYQFWGWLRTKHEYREMISKSGFSEITDGFIHTKTEKIYFIKGMN